MDRTTPIHINYQEILVEHVHNPFKNREDETQITSVTEKARDCKYKETKKQWQELDIHTQEEYRIHKGW